MTLTLVYQKRINGKRRKVKITTDMYGAVHRVPIAYKEVPNGEILVEVHIR